ncbi:MAG: helix-turn-helix transcriptional regulator [Opitutaceae bacterium]
MTYGKLPEEGFVRLETILQVIPVSRSTWFRGVNDGRFPHPVKLSERASAWRVEEIRMCMEKIVGKDGSCLEPKYVGTLSANK